MRGDVDSNHESSIVISIDGPRMNDESTSVVPPLHCRYPQLRTLPDRSNKGPLEGNTSPIESYSQDFSDADDGDTCNM